MKKFNFKKWIAEQKKLADKSRLFEQSSFGDPMCYGCQNSGGMCGTSAGGPLNISSTSGPIGNDPGCPGTVVSMQLSALEQQSGYVGWSGAYLNGSYIGNTSFTGISSGCGLGSATGYFTDQAFVNSWCGLSSPPPSSACDQSAWSNFNNWTNNFTTNMTNAPWFNNANQPCQFLANRIIHWQNVMQTGANGGPVGPIPYRFIKYYRFRKHYRLIKYYRFRKHYRFIKYYRLSY